MIDDETKEKLLREFEKSGNIYSSCLKVGISRSSCQRWIKNNKEFRGKARQRLRLGRKNMYDVCKHVLMKKITKGEDLKAIIYGCNLFGPKEKRVGYAMTNISDIPQRLRNEIIASQALPPIEVRIVNSKKEIINDKQNNESRP